jgi:hypothetical protein
MFSTNFLEIVPFSFTSQYNLIFSLSTPVPGIEVNAVIFSYPNSSEELIFICFFPVPFSFSIS